eukprot:TRINITY_DN84_c0_g1_i2.p1 TRINITY_DN84_c0_g1~~TRINITY_DN84_c0_g1_i2.p1  ORF type:complete len:135 (+),score=62.09 TRINITY_DN84_c0_g1_i2:50-454(+)
MAPGPEEEVDEEEVGAEGLLWVSKDLIEKVSKAIEDKKEVSKDDVEKLIDSDEIADDALMVPCDMSVAADVEDIDSLIETEGASKAAEIFVKARKKFQESLQGMPEADKAKIQQEMTGAEYKQMMEEVKVSLKR